MAASRLLIATNNAHKALEMHRLLGHLPHELTTPAELGLRIDVAEDGETFHANAVRKARAFATASGLLALADDSGLEVDALGGRPGVRSARYGGSGLSDEGRVDLLLRELADVPEEQRTCRYRAVLALVSPDGAEETAEGTCEGTVAREPDGANGFGYDPVFFVPSRGKTMARLSPEEKDAISHRGHAARAIAELLPAWPDAAVVPQARS